MHLGCTVADLEDRLSAKEYGEWVEFFNLEPFGWEAECFKAGIVAATVANVNRDHKKKPKPFEAIDFVPGAKRDRKRIDPKELKANLMAAFAGARNAGKDNVHDQGRKGDGKSPKAIRTGRCSPRRKQRLTSRRKADR